MTLVMIAELVGLTACRAARRAPCCSGSARADDARARTRIRAPLMLLVPVLHWTGHLSYAVLLRARARSRRASAPVLRRAASDRPRAAGRGRSRRHAGERALPGRDSRDDAAGAAGRRRADRHLRRAAACSSSTPRRTSSRSCSCCVFVPQRAPPTPPRRSRAACWRACVSSCRSRCCACGSRCSSLGDAAWQAFFAAVPVLDDRALRRRRDGRRHSLCRVRRRGARRQLRSRSASSPIARRARLVAISVPFQALPLWVLPLDVARRCCRRAIFASGIANGAATRRSTRR